MFNAPENNRRIQICVVTALLLVGCGATGPARTDAEEPPSMTAVGALRLVEPPGFDRTAETPRVVFTEAGGLRSPMQISVWLTDTPPTLANPRTRTLAGATAHYEIETAEGGSGGPVYILRASKTQGDNTIALEAEVQREAGEPAFDEAWSVLESARLR